MATIPSERQQAAIVALGKLLAAEQRAGYDDSAAAEGLSAYLDQWVGQDEGLIALAVVRSVVVRLALYSHAERYERQEALDWALGRLREWFRSVRAEQQAAAEDEAPAAVAAPQARRRKAAASADEAAVVPLHRQVERKVTPKREGASKYNELKLSDPIGKFPDLSARNAALFHRIGVHTLRDLLYHFPHRYDDYSNQRQIAQLEVGAQETVVAEVVDVRSFAKGIEVRVGDESGTLKVTFFGLKQWALKNFPVGRKLVLSGKVGSFQGMMQMQNPKWEPFANDELVHTGRRVPVHPLTSGLHENNARAIIKLAVDVLAPRVPELLPPALRQRFSLLPIEEAIREAHFPSNDERLAAARRRLGFDELFVIQLDVLRRRQLWQAELGHQFALNREVHADLLSRLPFALTGAQQRAIEQIFADVVRPVPMARLLQGDVGSGKTVVAAAALLQAVANGLQGALMAPTEILAEQHYKGLRRLLEGVRVPRKTPEGTSDEGAWQLRLDAGEQAELAEIYRILGMDSAQQLEGQGVRVALLTGGLGAKDRRRVLDGLAKGEVDIIIGTHALFTESVQYHSLGLVCIDEQHRFGVEQRNSLKAKGFNPHLLVMTATPIPRTMTMTIYGDLDVAVLDELPPGRQPIRTRWITRGKRNSAYQHMRKQIAEGRQGFVICPLVEASDKLDVPSAEELFEELQHEMLPDLRIGLIHGRMHSREKDQIMVAFRERAFDILVATAVIEVGIDIPNASTIIIEGAERFGLAQLHQFRGRVGRGAHQSYCILVSGKADNEVTQQRLKAMEETTDGFRLAELDLQLRGPGEYLGSRQSGEHDLKMADFGDLRLLEAARSAAEQLLQNDPDLAAEEHQELKQRLQEVVKRAAGAS